MGLSITAAQPLPVDTENVVSIKDRIKNVVKKIVCRYHPTVTIRFRFKWGILLPTEIFKVIYNISCSINEFDTIIFVTSRKVEHTFYILSVTQLTCPLGLTVYRVRNLFRFTFPYLLLISLDCKFLPIMILKELFTCWFDDGSQLTAEMINHTIFIPNGIFFLR